MTQSTEPNWIETEPNHMLSQKGGAPETILEGEGMGEPFGKQRNGRASSSPERQRSARLNKQQRRRGEGEQGKGARKRKRKVTQL